MKYLQEEILLACDLESHGQGTAESKKHDHKHHAKATQVPIDYLGQRLGIQASRTESSICSSFEIVRELWLANWSNITLRYRVGLIFHTRVLSRVFLVTKYAKHVRIICVGKVQVGMLLESRTKHYFFHSPVRNLVPG